MRLSLPFASVCVALAACGGPEANDLGTSTGALDPIDGHGRREPPMLGVHAARGAAKPTGTSSPNMTLHGGNVMSAVTIQPIFWGTSWANASFKSDKVAGLTQFYLGYAGSPYARTNVEYAGANGLFTTATNVTVGAVLTDTSVGPSGAPKTSAILAEVCKLIPNPPADGSGYYPVYTDAKRGHAGYCAWHSWGACNGVNVQFGFFFNLDGDSGCDPSDTASTWTQGTTALANVTGHELSEAVTDPRGDGWTDGKGAENADKCAWVFQQPAVLSDGSAWKIQGNWSNAAYTAGNGLPNSSGEKGCLYGN